MHIIGRRFSPQDFADYAKGVIAASNWIPKFVVLHNTSEPSLAQRPQGFTPQQMLNLADYYGNTMHWHAGPHLFIDDNGIWVFSPLNAPGVHSPSWNDESFGVEQLGEYDSEAYESGRGLAVQLNAIAAVAVLSHFAGIDSSTMKLHKMDPGTTHKDCPGINCARHYDDFRQAVHDYIVANLLDPAPDSAPADGS